MIGNFSIDNNKVADFIAAIRRIDDATVADDGRLHPLIRVAHASRVLAKASRFRGLFQEDCFGETPKPTRETRALPGSQYRAPLTPRFLRTNTALPCARPNRWSLDRE